MPLVLSVSPTKKNLNLIDSGVTQATQGSGFSGLRFAPVPIKIGTKPLQSLTRTQRLVAHQPLR
jgi:hypothetical protein